MSSPFRRKHITVGREAILRDTLDHLRSAADRKSKHHFLFLGPRGIGKSHLLAVIEDGIAEDPRLAPRMIVARLGGDENVTPRRSMALELYAYWTRTVARFVNQLWTDDSVTDEIAESLTRWAIDNLLPTVPVNVRADVQIGMAENQAKLVLIHILSDRGANPITTRSFLRFLDFKPQTPIRSHLLAFEQKSSFENQRLDVR